MNISFKNILFLAFLLFTIISCCDSNDDDDQVTHVDYEVEFFEDHPDLTYNPPVFENTTQIVLVKEERNQNSTTETFIEQILVKEAYLEYLTYSEEEFDIVNNVEANTTANVNCRDYFDISQINPITRPAEFMSIEVRRVNQVGGGPILPAEYATFDLQKTISDGELIEQANPNRGSNIVTFRIPSDVNINDYIESQFDELIINDCINGNGYIVR